MCGIVGFVGCKDAVPFLIEGLQRLEYRGYDSAGIAVNTGKELTVVKTVGKVAELDAKLTQISVTGNCGIGHTRWATHGAPSDCNAHPHFNADQTLSVVHNGIIENYLDIKADLTDRGYHFESETDTETIVHLLDYCLKQQADNTPSKETTLVAAVFDVLKKLHGSYALGIVSASHPDMFIAARKDSPLIVAQTEEGCYAASDISAVLKYTRDVYLLDDGEVAVLSGKSMEILAEDHQPIQKTPLHIDWDITAAEKGGYEHFMLKEIYEQPRVVKDTLAALFPNEKIHIEANWLTCEALASTKRIYIVACGTAYNAGLTAKTLIERLIHIPVIVDLASEFRYSSPILDENTLVILISQSGETADTIAAMRLAKQYQSRTLAVVNVMSSTIAREADDVIYTLAGPEIAVASTKAFTAQVVTLALLSLHIAQTMDTANAEVAVILKDLSNLPSLIDIILNRQSHIKVLAEQFHEAKNVFYIGRGLDYVTSMEGTLKLKELAYIHSESYAAGELKHGPIALLGPTTLVIGQLTQKALYEKTASNLQECKARGAQILAITYESNDTIAHYADDIFRIPDIHPMLSPALANIPQQLFAYYMALELGNDVDKPRNLAKSVTVE